MVNTLAHLFTEDTIQYVRRSGPDGTEVVLRSMSSGNERVIAGWPIKLLDSSGQVTGDWRVDGNEAATFVPAVDGAGRQVQQMWLYAEGRTQLVYQFLQPLTDCICRFGLPPPTLSFSADGRYLVSGWPVGKGATPLYVFEMGVHDPVMVADLQETAALWSRSGHTLYLTGGTPRSWTPEGGFASVDGARHCAYQAGLSPDGSEVAYTAFPDPSNQVGIRVYVYDLQARKTRLLIDAPRSEVTFVKDGWVWYFEERPCADCPGQTAATGPVYAMELASGREQQVVFAAGESPVNLQSSWSAGEFWPDT